MTHYISTTTKKLVGRNNQACSNPLVIDYDTLFDLDFSFVNSKNQLEDLADLSGLYIAGGLVDKNDTIGEIIFLCEDYEISGNILTFKGIDTYTEEFLDGVTKKYQPINIEIGQITDNQKQVLLRDQCLASPRVRVSGQDPTPITGDYYTKEELNAIVDNLSSFVIRETEATAELMHLTPVETLSGASGMIDKGKVYYLDMKEDFTLSVEQPEGLQLKEIPSGVADTYNMGTRTITRNVCEYTFTGDETWSILGYNSTLEKYRYGYESSYMPLKGGTGQAGYCDRYEVYRGEYAAPVPNNSIRFGQSNSMIYFFSDTDMTLEQMQAMTSGMTIKYPLAFPWQEQFGGPWLRTVGDVSDTWDPDTGIITRRIGVHKFTGNETITSWREGVHAPAPSCAGYFYRNYIYPLGERGRFKVLMNTPGLELKNYNDIYAGQAGYCGNVEAGMGDTLGPFIRVNPDDFSAPSEIVPWLARNRVEMWYIFETPREEHFTTTPVAIEIGDPRPYAPEDYGEAVLFVKPNEYAFTAENMLLDAEMGNFSTYRMLISWTPVGVLCEQTGAWTD